MTRENMDNLEIILINFPNMATIVFNPTVDDVSSVVGIHRTPC